VGQDRRVIDPAAAVLAVARRVGLRGEDLTALRSTNHSVFLLPDAALVAKVHESHAAAERERAIGFELGRRGAPVVPPARGIGDRVHTAGGRHITFWERADHGPCSNRSVGLALGALHGHLLELGDLVGGRTVTDALVGAQRALDTRTFAPGLVPVDRQLLRASLAHAAEALDDAEPAIVHGSPHRMNIVSRHGGPHFVDLETVQRGPVEWDLGHLEPAVAGHYPGRLDPELLAQCRTAVSAATATWCWGALEAGPDMRRHAEHHLAVVRSSRS
jgi:Ser/Thr protein kinase RdoA (MazF antagonist)